MNGIYFDYLKKVKEEEMSQTICSVCGAEIEENQLTCPQCGNEIERIGEENKSDMDEGLKKEEDDLVGLSNSEDTLEVISNEVQEELETTELEAASEETEPVQAQPYISQEENSEENLIEPLAINAMKEEFIQIQREGVEKILSAFDEKLLYDQMKEKQIDRLHEELQEYKRDLVSKTIRPIINGLIVMHDDMDKTIKKLSQVNEEISNNGMIKILTGVKEDIEILLEENGVLSFEEIDDKFNPKRQQVIKKIGSPSKEDTGKIVEHIRPGFESGDSLIRKERVAVYVYDNTLDTIAEESEKDDMNSQDIILKNDNVDAEQVADNISFSEQSNKGDKNE